MRRGAARAMRLRAYWPGPAVLGILLLSLGAFSSVSTLLYEQFRSLLIGQGVQLADQFARSALAVLLVRDISGIEQTAAVFRQFPGVRSLAVLDAAGAVRYEAGAHPSATHRVRTDASLVQAGLVAEDSRVWQFAAPIVLAQARSDSPLTEAAGPGTQVIGQVLIEMDKGALGSLQYLLVPLNVLVWIVLTVVVLRWAHRVSEVDRQKSAFMATITHEMRTPLHAIIGHAELALEAVAVYDEQPAPGGLEAVLSSARQLSALIDHILDAHQLEAGKMKLLLERTDLRAVIDEALQSVAPAMARHGNRLIEHVHTAAPITIDPGKLLQVLQNLLSNAAKFTHAGTVTLRVEQTPRQLVIEVSDTGIGIPPGKESHIFEPFRKVDTRDAARYEGSGLGLAISRGFVALMGGTLTVESRVSVGSTFTTRIPLPVSAVRARGWTW